ncbi:calcium-binding protein, partial [Aestuariicoccus sp. MJ-SS9]|uniref:calcium-binding protein n=1 Tax=Aestuariicoccus sp. MJ-SS9 TaxID=3079855 RepID=UPI002915AAA3
MASFNYGDGDDTITGTEFGDDIWPGGGNDVVYAFAGDDTIWSDQGNDYYDGGLGFDRLFYRNDISGVTVDLLSGTATDGWGNTDTLVSIERVSGSNYDDFLYGTNDRDSFSGEQGNDYIDGRGGNDFVWYGRATSGIVVDLAAETATGGEGVDTLVSIEFIGGSNYSDFLYGSSADNWFSPDAEGDIFTPNFDVGGNDYVDGRGGQDGVSYSGAVAAVYVDLGAGTATDGLGNTDTLVSIEAAIGSQFDDVLYGSSVDNSLVGQRGSDLLYGLAGNDTNIGGDGNDRIVGGLGSDFVDAGAGNDLIIDEGLGDWQPGTFVIGARGRPPVLPAPPRAAGQDDDVYIGGTGNDFYRFVSDPGMDTISGFEAGSGFGDRLGLTALGIETFAELLAVSSDTPDGVLIDLGQRGSILLEGVRVAELDPDDLHTPTPILLKGVGPGDLSGFSVSSAGDVDGDGLDDVIIGARDGDPDGVSRAGESYLVFGSALAAEQGDDGTLDLAT